MGAVWFELLLASISLMLILTAALEWGSLLPHFIEEDTEAQITSLRNVRGWS